MDAAKLSTIVASFSLEPLKEPLGFLRLIEFILAIFAFSICAGSGFLFNIVMECDASGTNNKKIAAEYSYPFILKDSVFSWTKCSDGSEVSSHIPGSFASQSEFFVAIGVLCFLYSIITLLVYIFFDKLYRSNDKIPMLDFIVTAVLALMWLISSSAWADAIRHMSNFADEDYITREVVKDCTSGDYECRFIDSPNFSAESISVIFGFLNCLVWCGNLWFLYKETNWFKVRAQPATDQTTATQNV